MHDCQLSFAETAEIVLYYSLTEPCSHHACCWPYPSRSRETDKESWWTHRLWSPPLCDWMIQTFSSYQSHYLPRCLRKRFRWHQSNFGLVTLSSSLIRTRSVYHLVMIGMLSPEMTGRLICVEFEIVKQFARQEGEKKEGWRCREAQVLAVRSASSVESYATRSPFWRASERWWWGNQKKPFHFSSESAMIQ